MYAQRSLLNGNEKVSKSNPINEKTEEKKDGKWSVNCGLGRQLLKEVDERRMGEQMNEWIDMHIDSIN